MRIGILGCGNIGKFLLKTINKDMKLNNGKIVSIYSRNKEKTEEIAAKYDAKSFEDIESFLDSKLDLIVEAATIELVEEVALRIIHKKIDLIVSSIGVFSDESFLTKVKEACFKNDVNIYIPSGAIGGLDILKSSSSLGGLETVQVVTRKPPKALTSSETIMTKQKVFSGSASEAIKLFPRNMNIAIAVSLAGIGPYRTQVKIIADPSIEKNKHSIYAKGSFGEFNLNVVNEAMPCNPKTSYLAALSVFSSIKHQHSRLKVG